MFKRVLLCHDGSQPGRRALRRGAELAILVQAHVDVLLIAPNAPDAFVAAGAAGAACIADAGTDHYLAILKNSVAWLQERHLSAQGYLCSGDTLDQITHHAKKLGTDLIVLGHYPQPSGGFWWSGPQRTPLAVRTRCCIFVAVDTPDDPAAASAST